ncbi:hypothetical protein [Streptomyces atratus]|uniref:hypothetical protein n=1 Tax=Streptomyces atratus TaxID=1893 RepID=UPI002B1E7EAF|nr:hypothetical protein [Streptomyces atratus]
MLRLYLFTRLGLWLVAYCAAWLSPAGSDARTPAPWPSRWEQWDWAHYQHIAQYGYFDPFPGIDPASDNRVAFLRCRLLSSQKFHRRPADVSHPSPAADDLPGKPDAVPQPCAGRLAQAAERQTSAVRELSRRAFPETEAVPQDAPTPIEDAGPDS